MSPGQQVYAVALCILLGVQNATAADRSCKDNPRRTGDCYWVQGVYDFTDDGTSGLWPDKGGIIYVQTPHGTRSEAPESVIVGLDRAHRKTGTLRAAAHGLFQVCPFSERRNGDLDKFVCIQSIRHLSIRDR